MHSFRPHLDGLQRAFTKMLYPFVKKLPKGQLAVHTDTERNSARDASCRHRPLLNRR